jgi:hypothetical protein
MFGPGEKTNELTLNEEVEILSAEIDVEYNDSHINQYDEYHIVFNEEF